MPRNIMNSDWAHTSNITDVTNVGLLVVATNVQHTYIYICTNALSFQRNMQMYMYDTTANDESSHSKMISISSSLSRIRLQNAHFP